MTGNEQKNTVYPRIASTHYEVNNNQVVEMTGIRTTDFTPIYEAIAKTNQVYAPKLLNQILRQIYKASYASDGAESIAMVGVSHADELPQNKKTVVGIRKDIRIYDFLKYGVGYLENSAPPQSPSSAPSFAAEPNGSAGALPTPDLGHA